MIIFLNIFGWNLDFELPVCGSGNIPSHPAQNIHLFWANEAFLTVSVLETLIWASSQMFSFNRWFYIQTASLEKGNGSQVSVKDDRKHEWRWFVCTSGGWPRWSWMQCKVEHELFLLGVQSSSLMLLPLPVTTSRCLLSRPRSCVGIEAVAAAVGVELSFLTNAHPLEIWVRPLVVVSLLPAYSSSSYQTRPDTHRNSDTCH